MPRYLRSALGAASIGLTLLAGSAHAQTPPPAPPVARTPPPAAPAPAAIDPKVTALFGQAVAAHQALSALSATITIASTGNGPASAQTATVEFLKPGKAKITLSRGGGPADLLLSDGARIIAYDVKAKKYRAQPVPAGANAIAVVLSQAHARLAQVMAEPTILNQLLAQPGVTAKLGAPGNAIDTVIATLPIPQGGAIQIAFDLGKDDHLVRRLSETVNITSGPKPQTFTLTETVTALSAAPKLTAADFRFTPPVGVTKIADTPAKAGAAEPAMHDPRLVPGTAPFPVTASDLSGSPISLAQYKGKVVLMDFWATWCGPCVGEMPNVIAAYSKYHAQGFDVVGISLDQDKSALTGFIASNKMPWRQVFDGKGWGSAVPNQYGVKAIPFGLLIGRDGKIAAVDVRGPALTTAIEKALAK